MLPRLQIHNQHVEFSPIPVSQHKVSRDLSSRGPPCPHISRKSQGKESKAPRLGYTCGSSSPSQPQDGIPVKQPVAPSSALAGSAPTAGQMG